MRNLVKRFTDRRLELFFFGAYLLLNAVLDQNVASHLDIDSHKYLELGERFLSSGQFVTENMEGKLVADYSRTPIFPLLLAAAIGLSGSKTAGVLLVVWFQRVVWGAVVLFLLPRARRGNGRGFRGWNVFAKISLLISPVVIYHGTMLLTDLFYAALLFLTIRLSLFSFRRNNRIMAALAGFLHGCCTLLRPLHAPVPFVTCLPWVRKRGTCVVLIMVVSLVMALAWMGRTYWVTGSWSLGSVQGRSLALHREEAIRRMEPTQSSVNMGPQFIEAVKSTNESVYTAGWILMRDERISGKEADYISGEVAWESIRLYPGSYLGGVLSNMGRLFWSRADGESVVKTFFSTTSASQTFWGWANAIGATVTFFLLPVFLLIRRVPRRLLKSRGTLTYALAGAYVALLPTLTTVTYGRFLLPALPFIGLIYCAADSGRSQQKFLSPEARENEKF